MFQRVRSERGVGILVALFATMLMTALATGLTLSAITETMIAANFRSTRETEYAAEAVLDLAIAELANVINWSAVLSGHLNSPLTDSAMLGTRQLPGITVNLTGVVGLANCAKTTGCSEAEMDAVTTERPWGPNNPRWTPYLHAALKTLAPGAEAACCYVVALVADDPSENDDDPRADGSDASNPGSNVVVVRGEAFGLHGSHAVRTATISRRSGGLRMLSWRLNLP